MNRTGWIDQRLRATPDRIDFQGKTTTDDADVEYICSKTICPNIKHIILTNYSHSPNSITHKGIFTLHVKRWDSLTMLHLVNNNIGDKGCKYLTKAYMPMLNQSSLQGNSIGDAGLLHLSKAAWRRLNTLQISSQWAQGRDFMRVGGYFNLIRANWPYLRQLIIGRPYLTIEEAKNIFLCHFALSFINIDCGQGEMKQKCQQIQPILKAKYPKAQLYI